MGKAKLELTWIGKENRPKRESRILLEDAGNAEGEAAIEVFLGSGCRVGANLKVSVAGNEPRLDLQ